MSVTQGVKDLIDQMEAAGTPLTITVRRDPVEVFPTSGAFRAFEPGPSVTITIYGEMPCQR